MCGKHVNWSMKMTWKCKTDTGVPIHPQGYRYPSLKLDLRRSVEARVPIPTLGYRYPFCYWKLGIDTRVRVSILSKVTGIGVPIHSKGYRYPWLICMKYMSELQVCMHRLSMQQCLNTLHMPTPLNMHMGKHEKWKANLKWKWIMH